MQQITPYKTNGSGKSTCLSACNDGFTTNGDPLHKCEACHEMCETCADDGKVGDKDLCKTCSKEYPFMYSATSTCMKECGLGFYKVNDKTCDKCSSPCYDCQSDKYNCTLCDSKGTTPALFVSSRTQNDQTIVRGTCRSVCPNGYFFDKTLP